MPSFSLRATALAIFACSIMGWLRPALAAVASRPAPEENTPIAVDPVQEKELSKAAAAQGTRVLRTGHFVIAYNVAPELVRGLSTRLEQTYDSVSRFCQRCGFPVRPLPKRLEVVFLDTWQDYERFSRQNHFKCEGTYGFYYDRTNRSAFFNVENDPTVTKMQASIKAARESVDRMEETIRSIRGNEAVEIVYNDHRRERMTKAQAKSHLDSARRDLEVLDAQHQNYCDRINRTVVQHEIAHQVLYNNGVHVRGAMNPRWLMEGLACIFETPPTGAGSGLGAVNQARLRDFRQAVAGPSETRALTTAMYAEAVTAGRMVPLRRLLSEPKLFDERGERASMYYAAAWGLIHYLHRMQNKALSEYLQAVAARPAGTAMSGEQELKLFEKHFGSVNDAFTIRFSAYILKLPTRGMPGELN